MNIAGKMQLRSYLFLGLLVLIVILAVTIAFSYVSASRMQVFQQNLYREKFISALDLKDIRSNQSAIREDMLEAELSDNSAFRVSKIHDAAQRTAETDKDIQAVAG